MISAVSLPSEAGQWMTLWPSCSTEPVSWTQMCPVSAAMTASQGRRYAPMAVLFTWVPPAKKWTAASGAPQRARMASAAS